MLDLTNFEQGSYALPKVDPPPLSEEEANAPLDATYYDEEACLHEEESCHDVTGLNISVDTTLSDTSLCSELSAGTDESPPAKDIHDASYTYLDDGEMEFDSNDEVKIVDSSDDDDDDDDDTSDDSTLVINNTMSSLTEYHDVTHDDDTMIISNALSEMSEQDDNDFSIGEYIFFDARCDADLSTEVEV
jgi:hypothetical protein